MLCCVTAMECALGIVFLVLRYNRQSFQRDLATRTDSLCIARVGVNVFVPADSKVAVDLLVVARSKVRARKDRVMKDGVEHQSIARC